MIDILNALDNLGAQTDDALDRFMDDRDMYLKYVRTFPDEPTMARLAAAVDAADYKEAERAVHALKGIVVNLGFLPLADATVDMLEELRSGSIDAALDAYKDLQTAYARFTQVINEWRSAE